MGIRYLMGKGLPYGQENNKTKKIDYIDAFPSQGRNCSLSSSSPQVTKETVIKGKMVPLLFHDARL